MSYVPTTEAQRREMLAACGVPALDSLFADIPAELRAPEVLCLPGSPNRKFCRP